MKTKVLVDPKILNVEKLNTKAKLKSLRPMRSMVAIRSLKPKTIVGSLNAKAENENQLN